MVTARASKVRVEDLSQREPDTRVFANPDGTWTAEAWSEPQFTHDGDPATEPGIDGTGAWHRVDNTLVHRDGGWAPKHGASDVLFSNGGDWLGKGAFARLTRGGHELAFGLGGKNTDVAAVALPAPIVAGDTAVYADIAPSLMPGVALVVRATATGFAHWIVLTNRPDVTQASRLVFPLTVTDTGKPDSVELLKGAVGDLKVAEPASGGSKQKSVVSAPPPIAWDASTAGPDDTDPARTALRLLGHPIAPAPDATDATASESSTDAQAASGEAAADGDPVEPVVTTVTNDVSAGVATNNTGAAITSSVVGLGVTAGFLTDPDTMYPVTIDPSMTINAGDTWVQTPDYTTSQKTSTEIRVGDSDSTHHANSYLNFTTTAWNGKVITGATLYARNFSSATCGSGAIQAARISQSWNPDTITWGTQPAADGTYASTFSPAYGGGSPCPANWATWNVQPIVQAWANGSYPNYGIRLHAAASNSPQVFRKYRSANYSDTTLVPHISVTYNAPPNVANYLTISPYTRTSSGDIYTRTAQPMVGSKAGDADGGSVYYTLRAFTSPTATTGALASCSTPWAPQGTIATCTLSPALPQGTYYLRALSSDAYQTAATWGTSLAFTVDTVAPTASITSSAFQNGKWSVTPPTTSTFTLNGPDDTVSCTYSIDGQGQTSAAANATGDCTFNWSTTAGAHTVSAYAVDRAGNVGPASTFNFGAGAPALDTTSVPSTGTFPLELKGPPNATGATLSWRYAGHPNDTWRTLTGVTTAAGGSWSGTVTTDTAKGLSSTTPLVWDATTQADSDSTPDNPTTITAPAFVEVQGCFTYTSGPPVCSDAQKLQLVPAAFGGNFPVTNIGPATVALFTGEISLSEPDAVDSAAGVGRTFTTFDAATLANPTRAGAFGPGWSTTLLAGGDGEASLVDHRTKDGTMVLVTQGGASQMYSPVDSGANVSSTMAPVVFKPTGADDGSRLTIDLTTSDTKPDWTATLVHPQGASGGATTTWTSTPSGNTAGSWALDKTADVQKNAANDPDVAFARTGGLLTWIAQTKPGETVSCTATNQTEGCRGLQIAYTTLGTGTSAVQRIDHIDRLVTSASTTGTLQTSAERLATYTYTSNTADALLAKVCGPDPDGDATTYVPLCSTYDYDTTSVASRTLLQKVTAVGQKPWEFAYDARGRLTSVKRDIDTSDSTGTGPAVWRVAYDINPSASEILPDLTTGQAARWGQTQVPLRAAAVYTPDDGLTAAPTSGDLPKADLWYYDIAGTVTNTAVHGNTTSDGSGPGEWLINTSWYDSYGHTIRTLDAAGRASALASSTDAAEQARAAALASTFTFFSSDGSRVEDEYGPAHMATLTDGTKGIYRAHTAYVYDGAADSVHASSTLGGGSKPAYPADTNDADGDGNTAELSSTTYNLVVEERHSAADPDMLIGSSYEHDARTIRYEYDPIVTGDGNGWKLGNPTRTKAQLADGTWITATTRYDPSGHQIETRQPGGSGDATAAGNDAHSTFNSYYATGSADNTCDIAGHPERARWAGLLCKTGPAAPPSGVTVPITTYASYNDNLQPLVVAETSGSTTRTTTNTYDALGRVVTTAVTVVGSGAAADTRRTTISYDRANGLPASVSDAGSTGVTSAATVSTAYDSWGRVYSYTNASGGNSSTTYTPEGRTATFNDGSGTYTYTYDTTGGEQRGVITSVDTGLAAGVADVFGLRYDAAGATSRVTYPGGLSANYEYDETGAATSLDYTKAGATEPLMAFANTLDVDGRVVGATSSTGPAHEYTYDNLGRLVRVADTRPDTRLGTACTTRIYGFTAASDRSTSASYDPGADGGCQTSTTASSKTAAYDTANRITNTGYSYDTLGRTVTTPAIDTNSPAGSALSASYYANDMVKTLAQTVPDGVGGTIAKQNSYALDPTGRINMITATSGTTATRTEYLFSGPGDSPSRVSTTSDGGASWTSARYLQIPGLGMAGAVTAGALTLELANLHGDIAATQDSGGYIVKPETDEYGNVEDGAASSDRYRWLGSAQRPTDTLGGLMLMGARLYNPSTGLFLSVDPVPVGNPTPYSYPQDPINSSDITGRFPSLCNEWCRSKVVSVGMKIIDVALGAACAATTAMKVGCDILAGGLSGGIKYFLERKFVQHRSVSWSGVGNAALVGALSSIGGGFFSSAVTKSIKKVLGVGAGRHMIESVQRKAGSVGLGVLAGYLWDIWNSFTLALTRKIA